MKFTKLPLSLAIAAAVSTGGAAFAEEYERGGSSVEIDKEIVYNQNINNSGQITTMGLILVDSSAAAVSEVKQESSANEVVNKFDTRNNASLSDSVLQDATGNIGVNIAAGDNNVQQNSVAIANASSASSSINLEIDYTEGATNHADSHTQGSEVTNRQSREAGDWRVNGSVDYSHATTEVVTVDDWSVDTEQNVSARGDATGHAGGGGGAEAEGMAAWGEFGVGGGGGGHVTFLDDGETQDTDAAFSATTRGHASGSAEFTEDESVVAHVDGTAGASGSSSSNYHKDDSYETNASHDDDYRLNVAFDADFVFGGAADAETFSEQYAVYNGTINNGVVNDATVGDNVGTNAAGNIGINVAAGNSNVQTNQLAIANNDGVLSTATASSQQLAMNNVTSNNSLVVYETKSVRVGLSGSASGTYEGISDQVGNLYPDIWIGENDNPNAPHTTNDGFWGHVDLDAAAQGAVDRNGDGGALSFNESGELELDNIALTGTVSYREARYQGHRNNASLGDNALSGASGNIGLNIAAGTNNLQGNALAISNASLAIGGGE